MDYNTKVNIIIGGKSIESTLGELRDGIRIEFADTIDPISLFNGIETEKRFMYSVIYPDVIRINILSSYAPTIGNAMKALETLKHNKFNFGYDTILNPDSTQDLNIVIYDIKVEELFDLELYIKGLFAGVGINLYDNTSRHTIVQPTDLETSYASGLSKSIALDIEALGKIDKYRLMNK